MHNAVLPRRCLTIFGRHSRVIINRSLNPNRHITRRSLLTLAIETSCDDTCVAILETNLNRHESRQDDKNNVISNEAINQKPRAQLHFDGKITAKNTGLGGIHPLEALDSHRSHLAKLVDKAMLSLPIRSSRDTADLQSQITCRDGSIRRKPDFVSVTRGPGMRSNLACGLETAKGLAVAWQIPLVGVHHMQAHALTPRMIHAMNSSDNTSKHQPDFPFLTLLVSGGHTMLLYSTGLTEHKVLINTIDVAIGDALDRCGWILLPEDIKTKAQDTAFGKHLSQYAFPDHASVTQWPIARSRKDEAQKPPNRFGWQMQTPFSETRDMKFSFASMESRVVGVVKECETRTRSPISPEERLLLAQTVIGCSFEHLGSRIVMALEMLRKQGVDIRHLIVSGGVAANDFLRYHLGVMLGARGFEEVQLVFPPVKYCTDNAAMIAWAGTEMFEAGHVSDFGIDAIRKWSMDTSKADGGILGVDGWHRNDAGKQLSRGKQAS